jgi:hypothetical protein
MGLHGLLRRQLNLNFYTGKTYFLQCGRSVVVSWTTLLQMVSAILTETIAQLSGTPHNLT